MRRGALAGTAGGFLAGWLAFAAHAAGGTTVADASSDVSYDAPAAVPAMPTLRPLPTRAASADPTATSAPAQGATTVTVQARPAAQPAVAPAAPAPVFTPIPKPVKVVVKPIATTAPSPVRK